VSPAHGTRPTCQSVEYVLRRALHGYYGHGLVLPLRGSSEENQEEVLTKVMRDLL
jgi:hypothetical protein